MRGERRHWDWNRMLQENSYPVPHTGVLLSIGSLRNERRPHWWRRSAWMRARFLSKCKIVAALCVGPASPAPFLQDAGGRSCESTCESIWHQRQVGPRIRPAWNVLRHPSRPYPHRVCGSVDHTKALYPSPEGEAPSLSFTLPQVG